MHLSEEIGARLQDERKRLGLNQDQAAALLGCSKRTQAAYEAGTSEAGMVYMSKAAAAGFDVLYIATGTRTPRPVEGLSVAEEKVLDNYRSLPEEDQASVRRLTDALAESVAHHNVKGKAS